MPTCRPRPAVALPISIRAAAPRSSLFLGLASLLLAGLLPTAVAAQPAWSTLPNLPQGQRAAIGDRLDPRDFSALDGCLRELDSAVGAEYFAAVVEVTAASGRASADESNAVPYVDALYRKWRRDGHLDPEDHVVLVLGLANRSVAIHPGIRWADAGFEGAAITRTIEQSRFGDLARGGDLDLALCELGRAVDQSLARLLDGGQNPATAAPNSPPAGAAIRTGDGDRQRGDSGSLLGGLLVLGLPLLLLAFLVRAWSRRRRAYRLFLDEKEPWAEKLGHAAERLLQLEQHHPIYFSPEGQRWTGESRALDQACADAVNRVYLLYAQATQLLGRAEHLAEQAGPFGASQLEEARELLRDTEISFDTGTPAEGADHRRIFLPLTVEYRATARQLLADLDASYAEAIDRLDEVAEVDRTFRDRLERADRAAEKAIEASQRRRELGLDAEPATAAMEPHLATKEKVVLELSTDPVRCLDLLQSVAAQLEAIGEATAEGNALVESVRGPLTELGRQLRAQVDSLREAGIEPVEPGFQPDLRLDRGVLQTEKIVHLLDEGKDPEAKAEHASLERGMMELGEQLDAIAEAPGRLPEAIEGLRREVALLRERTPEARQHLETLRAEHAPEAFVDEADNLEELDTLSTQLDEWLDHIAEDERNQHYLSALADLETAIALVAAGHGLVDELARAETELAELRSEIDARLGALGDLLNALESRASSPAVTAEMAAEARTDMDEARAWLRQDRSDRPDWRRLAAESEAHVADLQRWLALFGAEIAARDQALAEAEALEQRWHELEQAVQREKRDRPHVRQAVDQAAAALRQLGEARSDEAIGGRQLLEKHYQAAELVDWSHGIWKSELDSIHLAEAELSAAQALVQREQGRDFGRGTRADLSPAHDLLDRARAARGERQWEEVLELARRASQAVNQAVRQAREEAARREQEWQHQLERRREAERRRRQRRQREMMMDATIFATRMAGSAAATWGSSQTSGSSFGRSRRRGSRPSISIGRSRGSFGGGSFGGGRGGSFGGSRSGGSSW